MYADYNFYLSHYPADGARLNPQQFCFYAKKASAEMDAFTGGRITAELAELDAVKLCCCELCGVISSSGGSSSGGGVAAASESVGDYSVSYGSIKERSAAEKQRKREIMQSWLSNLSGLSDADNFGYRGVARHVL